VTLDQLYCTICGIVPLHMYLFWLNFISIFCLTKKQPVCCQRFIYLKCLYVFRTLYKITFVMLKVRCVCVTAHNTWSLCHLWLQLFYMSSCRWRTVRRWLYCCRLSGKLEIFDKIDTFNKDEFVLLNSWLICYVGFCITRQHIAAEREN